MAVAASYGTGALATVTAVATAGNTAIAAALLEAIALEGTCALATMPSQLVHLYCTHRSCTAKNSERSSYSELITNSIDDLSFMRGYHD